MGQPDEGIGGLAKRWLRSKVKEMTTGDRHERADASVEANRAEHGMKQQVSEEAMLTAFPGLRRMKEQQEAAATERERQREAERVAELQSRPLAAVDLTLTGAVEGSWSGQLPTRVERRAGADEPDEYDPYAQEAQLRVDLTPLDEHLPVFAGQPFLGWRFVLTGYTGPGTYDLEAVGQARETAGHDLDSTEYDLVLGSYDEPYYWYPGAGPSTVTVADDGKRLSVAMGFGGASGDLRAVAEIRLP